MRRYPPKTSRPFAILLLALILVFVLLAILARRGDGQALSWRQKEILATRARVHGCQDRLGLHRSAVAQRIIVGGSAYRAWVLRRWRLRHQACRAMEVKLADPVQAILAVFGRYGWQAVSVARCETGGTFSTSAANGQYLGLFQMGDYARSRYGHSSTPLGQARAAFAYFADAGYDWSPWECKP